MKGKGASSKTEGFLGIKNMTESGLGNQDTEILPERTEKVT